MSRRLSWALEESVVQVCGVAFWYKRPLRQILTRSGVPEPLIRKYDDLSKFKLIREILAELDGHGESGLTVQRNIVRELAAIRTITDPGVDRLAAEAALRQLREIAREEGVISEPDRVDATEAKKQRAANEARVAAQLAEAEEIGRLYDTYRALLVSADRQKRGYELEILIGELFRLHKIPYHPPYRKGTTEQTDGFFNFDGFQYLIEARWRESAPTIADLRAFSGKVAAKIESTRGLFVSIADFRDEVLQEASSIQNLIYMSGQDLALILERRYSRAAEVGDSARGRGYDQRLRQRRASGRGHKRQGNDLPDLQRRRTAKQRESTP